MAKFSEVSRARLAAFEILREVSGGGFSSGLLAEREPGLEAIDRPLCHELVMGVLRWQLQLDRVIEHYSGREIGDLDLAVVLSLRLALYQLRFLTRVPASAAVNESVNLVGLARLNSARSFVNAVLRRATREPEYDPAANVTDPSERTAVETSHPVWLIRRWSQSFGTTETEKLALANNQTPPIAFRIVQNRGTEAEVLSRLRNSGASIERSTVAEKGWRVSSGSTVLRDLAANGQIYLQDEASQLLAQVLDPRTGERVLDLCAAPGSKTTQIADLVNGRASIFAGEISTKRLRTLRKNVATQGLSNVQLLQLDAGKELPFRELTFDRVLVDAPCSGTGTLRRNPEIRWRLRADDILNHSLRQKQFLLNAAKVVKRGGRLVYSTCSLEPEENEYVVNDFLQDNINFRPISITQHASLADESGNLRTWPHRQGCDGFFIAAFERTAN